MIPANELAALQATATSVMDVAGIQVQRGTNIANGDGTVSMSWATISTVTGGWAKPTVSIMQQYAGLIGALAAWVVRLPYGTDCHVADRLIMPTGEILLVQADLSQSSYSTAKRVLASAVR